MKIRLRSDSGFTIVELLIVIVVIAILATITIVSYNNITSRAQQTQFLAAIDAYEKAFKMSIVENGGLPLSLGDIGSQRTTLGNPDNSSYFEITGKSCLPGPYAATNIFRQGECTTAREFFTEDGSSTPILMDRVSTTERTDVTQLLSPIVTALPKIPNINELSLKYDYRLENTPLTINGQLKTRSGTVHTETYMRGVQTSLSTLSYTGNPPVVTSIGDFLLSYSVMGDQQCGRGTKSFFTAESLRSSLSGFASNIEVNLPTITTCTITIPNKS